MRPIYVEEGLTLRFPARGEEFNQGVEIGIVAVLMAAGQSFNVSLSLASVDQARELADKMNFRVIVGPIRDHTAHVTFSNTQGRPALTLVKGDKTATHA